MPFRVRGLGHGCSPSYPWIHFAPDGYGAINTYQRLIRDLRNEFGINRVHFFPYDWRLDNAAHAVRLRDFIDSLNVYEVDIVAHSMGGLIAARYIADGERSGQGNRVRTLITLGTPYLGSPKVPYVFATGNMIDFGFWGQIPGLTRPITRDISAGIRNVSSHMISAYQLLPIRSPYRDHIATLDPVAAIPGAGLIATAPRTWTAVENEHDFIRDRLPMSGVSGSQVPASVRANFLNSEYIRFLESLFIGNTHAILMVDSHVIIGYNQPTIHTTIFNFGMGPNIRTLTFNTGDGTVPVWSANINGYVGTYNFRENHTGLVNNNDVIRLVTDLINGHRPGVDARPTRMPVTVIHIASPVDVTVTHNGETLSSTYEYFNTITDFGVLHFVGPEGNSKVLAFATENSYDILITGTGEGTMDYSIRFYDANGNLLEERLFLEVPITYNTIISTNTNPTAATNLFVDTNGDGTYDSILYPIVYVSSSPDETLPDSDDSDADESDEQIRGWWLYVVLVMTVSLLLIVVLIILLRSRKRRRQRRKRARWY